MFAQAVLVKIMAFAIISFPRLPRSNACATQDIRADNVNQVSQK